MKFNVVVVVKDLRYQGVGMTTIVCDSMPAAQEALRLVGKTFAVDSARVSAVIVPSDVTLAHPVTTPRKPPAQSIPTTTG